MRNTNPMLPGKCARRVLALALSAALTLPLLAGCAQETPSVPGETSGGGSSWFPLGGSTKETTVPVETTLPEETVPPTVPPTIPEDGDPNDVTCQGSYTVEDGSAADTVVATVGEAELTNGLLQVFYWMEVERYRQAGNETAPDFAKPLDTQVCGIDDSVGSWQQYFLKCALNAWHSSVALVNKGQEDGVPLEEAFQPIQRNYDIYMVDIPAMKELYGYAKTYEPNELHQAYLDGIPAMLETLAADNGFGTVDALAQEIAGAGADAADLSAYADLYNRAYMYFTTLNYYITAEEEERDTWFTGHEAAYSQAGITRDSGRYVDIRHVLLIPEGATVAEDGAVACGDEAWDTCEANAQAMLDKWLSGRDTSEPRFAELANQNSADKGSSINGGLYQRLHKGQLDESLDGWCFDEARQPGDTVVLRSDCGVHILYFSGSQEIWNAAAEEDLLNHKGAELVLSVRERYPMTVDYSAIKLAAADNTTGISADTLLYADIAHERYPVVPLYLQQDYTGTKYGTYSIVTNGCGITTMAMLATYMTDTELTPPTLCARYGKYSLEHGTDASMFNVTPAEMGFFLEKQSYDIREVKAAMAEGKVVVTMQVKGYFTSGGHYLVLEKQLEDGRVQIRDSNIYNYGKLHGHKEDAFSWDVIVPGGASYWIYQHKVTRIPTCARCGEPTGEGIPQSMFTESYQCEKCDAALQRRNSYLAASVG